MGLLFYDANAGESEFHNTDSQGNLTLVQSHNGWRTTWSQIVPGRFGGTSSTDLLFYDANAGESEFHNTDSQGNLTLVQSHNGWRTTWSQIVASNFGGAHSTTDLLFYD